MRTVTVLPATTTGAGAGPGTREDLTVIHGQKVGTVVIAVSMEESQKLGKVTEMTAADLPRGAPTGARTVPDLSPPGITTIELIDLAAAPTGDRTLEVPPGLGVRTRTPVRDLKDPGIRVLPPDPMDLPTMGPATLLRPGELTPGARAPMPRNIPRMARCTRSEDEIRLEAAPGSERLGPRNPVRAPQETMAHPEREIPLLDSERIILQ